MKILRRVMAALGLAGMIASALRLRGRGGTPPQHGGWQPVELSPGGSSDQSPSGGR